MNFTYQDEPADVFIPAVKPLLDAHYQETGTYKDIALKPDYAFYEKAAAAGLIRFFTARADGDLVGYAVIQVHKHHPHYGDQPWATSNLFWLHPRVRGLGIGRALLGFTEGQLAGYVFQIATSADNPELAELAKSEGYAPVEVIYSKRL